MRVSSVALPFALLLALACGGGGSSSSSSASKSAPAAAPSGPAQKARAELKSQLCNGEDPKGISASEPIVAPYLTHPKGVLLWIHPENGGKYDEPTWETKEQVTSQAAMTTGNYLCNPKTKCEGNTCVNEKGTGVLAFKEGADGRVALVGIYTTVGADGSPEAKATGEAAKAKFDAALAAE